MKKLILTLSAMLLLAISACSKTEAPKIDAAPEPSAAEPEAVQPEVPAKAEYVPDPEPEIPPQMWNAYRFDPEVKTHAHKNDPDHVFDKFPMPEFVVPVYKGRVIKDCVMSKDFDPKSEVHMMACPDTVSGESVEAIYDELLKNEGFESFSKETEHGPILITFESGEGEFDVKYYTNRDSRCDYQKKCGDIVDDRIPYPLYRKGFAAIPDQKDVISKTEIVYIYNIMNSSRDAYQTFDLEYIDRLKVYGFKQDPDNANLFVRKTADKKKLSVQIQKNIQSDKSIEYKLMMKSEDIQ